MMVRVLRILAILCLTLGFQLHGFVGVVTTAHAATCATVPAVEASADGAQAMQEKPSPSCKLIGAAGAALAHPLRASATGHRAAGENAPTAVWLRGPEKPPKRS